MTGSMLTDGSVNAWLYITLDGEVGDGFQPDVTSDTWLPLDYEHYGDWDKITTSLSAPDTASEEPVPTTVHTIDGLYVGSDTDGLSPGIYIIHDGDTVRKTVVGRR